jgi:hypothetical protein
MYIGSNEFCDHVPPNFAKITNDKIISDKITNDKMTKLQSL